MFIGRIQLVFHHLFQGHQIVHGSLGKENVLFHHTGDGIPFRLVIMPEGSPVPEPVKSRHSPQDDHRIVHILEHRAEKDQVLETGQLEQFTDAEAAEAQIGQNSCQDPDTMVLVEENIHQIVLFRFGPQLHGLVVDIVEVLVEQHFPGKSQVQHQTVGKSSGQPQQITPAVPGREKGPGQGQDHQRDQEHIGVEIHPPPESVPETVPEDFPFSLQTAVGIVDHNEDQTKNRTQNGKEQKQLRILLQGCVE